MATSVEFFAGVLKLLEKQHGNRDLVSGDPAAKSFCERLGLLADIEQGYIALPQSQKKPKRTKKTP